MRAEFSARRHRRRHPLRDLAPGASKYGGVPRRAEQAADHVEWMRLRAKALEISGTQQAQQWASHSPVSVLA